MLASRKRETSCPVARVPWTQIVETRKVNQCHRWRVVNVKVDLDQGYSSRIEIAPPLVARRVYYRKV